MALSTILFVIALVFLIISIFNTRIPWWVPVLLINIGLLIGYISAQ